MAVPTITTMTPTSGSAAGYSLVKFIGTNFQLYVSPTYGQTDGTYPETVRVLFDGVPSHKVYVYSSVELEALIPSYAGDIDRDEFLPVDVTLQNIDGDGILIPGEETSLSAAFTYIREALRPPTLEHETPMVRICRELIQSIKREVVLQTGLKTHTDFSADGIVLNKADVPSLFLMNPRMIPDAYGYENETIVSDQIDGSALNYGPPSMHTVVVDLVGTSNSDMEFLAMMTAARQYIRRHPYLVLEGDLPPNGDIRMPVMMTDEPMSGRGVENSNLRDFSATFEVRRIPVLYLPPDRRVWPVQSSYVDIQKPQGILVETISLW